MPSKRLPSIARSFFAKLLLGSAALPIWALQAHAAEALKVEVKPDPTTPQTGDNKLFIHVSDAKGRAVDQADVKLLVFMPAMGSMPRMDEKAAITAKGGGDYEASYQLSMGGSWELTLNVLVKDQKKSLHYAITTDIPGITDKNTEEATSGGTANTELLDVGPARLQMIGTRFAEAKVQRLDRTVRAVGVVEQDNTHREDVTVRFAGYVAKLFTGRVGDKVKKGQPLFSVYSPDLVTAQSEFFLSVKAQHSTATGNSSLLTPAEERLKNLGMTAEQIASLKRSGKPQRDIIIRSPIGGTILAVSASDGTAISAGQAVVTVGDLDKSYIVARVFQQDVGDIQLGQDVDIALPSAPGEIHHGRVDLVFPQLEPGAGTANVRVQNLDASLDLRPGAYVDLRFPVSLGDKLVIPVDAVLYSGLHNYVFVDHGRGQLEPREVFPGRLVGDKVEIRKGLHPGERVVASGTFLLGSEAQLRTALPKWSSPETAP